jgi:hypothetical protein
MIFGYLPLHCPGGVGAYIGNAAAVVIFRSNAALDIPWYGFSTPRVPEGRMAGVNAAI